MNQDWDNKWRDLCQAVAIERDSTKLMELVAGIITELDERAKKLKPPLVKKDSDESSLAMDPMMEVTTHAKAAYHSDSRASSVSG